MEFKELQAKIKEGKLPPEGLAKDWSSYLVELKTVAKQKQKQELLEKDKEMSRLKEDLARAQAVAAAAQQTRAMAGNPESMKRQEAIWEGRLLEKNAALVNAKQRFERQLSEKAAMLAQLNREMQELKAHLQAQGTAFDKESAGKDIEMKRSLAETDTLRQDLRHSHAQEESLRQDLALKEEALRAWTGREEKSLTRERDLLSQLEIKDREIEERIREIERLRYSLDRYQGGEVYRGLEAKIGELKQHLAQREEQVAAKQKELDDFKQYLTAKETQVTAEISEQARSAAKQNEALEDQLRLKQARIEELEAEVVSFRRLLRQVEGRHSSLEEEVSSLRRDRQRMLAQFQSLGLEVKDYQARMARHLAKIPEETGAPKTGTEAGVLGASKSAAAFAEPWDLLALPAEIFGFETALAPYEPELFEPLQGSADWAAGAGDAGTWGAGGAASAGDEEPLR